MVWGTAYPLNWDLGNHGEGAVTGLLYKNTWNCNFDDQSAEADNNDESDCFPELKQ